MLARTCTCTWIMVASQIRNRMFRSKFGNWDRTSRQRTETRRFAPGYADAVEMLLKDGELLLLVMKERKMSDAARRSSNRSACVAPTVLAAHQPDLNHHSAPHAVFLGT